MLRGHICWCICCREIVVGGDQPPSEGQRVGKIIGVVVQMMMRFV